MKDTSPDPSDRTGGRLTAQAGRFGPWSVRASTRQDLSPFTAADVAQVRKAAVEEYADVGSRLIANGDPVGQVIVLGSGEVELLAHSAAGRRVMALVRKGGVIGDIPLLLNSPAPFDAVVSRRALVCKLDREALLALLRSAPSASLRWMRSIAVRLDDDRRRLLAIMNSDLTGQVAFVLLEHAEMEAGTGPVVRLSHEVIAQLVGARRQSVSRVLADLRAQGLVSAAYRRIVVLDPEGLEHVAAPAFPSGRS